MSSAKWRQFSFGIIAAKKPTVGKTVVRENKKIGDSHFLENVPA